MVMISITQARSAKLLLAEQHSHYIIEALMFTIATKQASIEDLQKEVLGDEKLTETHIFKVAARNLIETLEEQKAKHIKVLLDLQSVGFE